MATFYNKATLSYGGNIVNSNTTEAELLSGLGITKTAITTSYAEGAHHRTDHRTDHCTYYRSHYRSH